MLLLSLAMILMMLLRPAGMIPARARYCHDKHLTQHLKQHAEAGGREVITLLEAAASASASAACRRCRTCR
jgi:amino acid/amide ABC transporter membrane protein 2, HAAT family (TC 3.A.1.4.-)